jgi:hypothetical protein
MTQSVRRHDIIAQVYWRVTSRPTKQSRQTKTIEIINILGYTYIHGCHAKYSGSLPQYQDNPYLDTGAKLGCGVCKNRLWLFYKIQQYDG